MNTAALTDKRVLGCVFCILVLGVLPWPVFPFCLIGKTEIQNKATKMETRPQDAIKKTT